MSRTCRVTFDAPGFAPVELEVGARLSERLDALNSPVLFGCRTGLCATCLSEVDADVPPPDDDEREILDLYAPDVPRARLLCQLQLTGDVHVVRALGAG